MKQNVGVLIGAVVAVALIAAAAYFLESSMGVAGDLRSMAKRGATEQEMLARVEKISPPIKLSADDVIALKRDKVPDSVTIAMLNRH